MVMSASGLCPADGDGAGDFLPPVSLDALNTPAFDGEPALYGPTCELIFVSARTGPFNLYRSYVSRR